ncbi:MAG: DUF2196 domain-containing protein [Proteobacteria bacterium]|nr:DUF2196 domain-containing protein [Pseudomonadota bacterium]
MILKNTKRLIQELYQRQEDTTHWHRENIDVGDFVCLIQKHHQRSGELTCGVVQRILTSKSKHTRGIKVQAITDSNEKIYGRVQEIYKPNKKNK